MNFSQTAVSISVIIPVFNGGEPWQQSLESVVHAQPAPQEIIVVNDSSTDNSGKLAQEKGLRVIELATNKGPAIARNRGAQAAKSDWLFFLDADVVIPPTLFAQAADLISKNPQVAAWIGSYDDAPGANNFLSQYRNLLHHYTHQQGRENASTFWGACGLIRRETFLASGGFDEAYRRPCIEDIELGYRLRRDNHQIRLCKALQIKHLKRWEVGSLLKTDICDRGIPWTRLLLRVHPLNNDLNIGWSSRISILSVYGILSSLAMFRWLPGSLILALICGATLLIINRPFYEFLRKKRGLIFVFQTLPWHFLYFVYSGLALAAGVCLHVSSDFRKIFC
ncbi:MAG: glycosyltransferase family 2 protein [Cyanobacteria bacterium P01_H01_bin.15]